MSARLIGQPAAAPTWALLQRHLLRAMAAAARHFVGRYTQPDGTLIWRESWPGMDGSDDGYESFGNFALFYALGGDADIHAISRREWDAVTRQFTAYGQVHNEFDGYYDWMHHGESSTSFYAFGFADPTVAKDVERTLRFAGMYLGEDPATPNWDAAQRLIRSPINGSRGPRFENSAEDWVTHRPILAAYPPPFEDIPGAPGPLCDWNDDRIFGEVLERLNARMMRGDVPLNLACTSLVTHAYAYTGDEKYRRWVLDYTAAWRERAAANGGLIPDNVGPSGQIGECLEGKWYGGYYGYRWPHGINTILEPVLMAAANCLLLTGDSSWLDFPRSQLELLIGQGERRDGVQYVPHRHGDAGWYDFRPLQARFHTHLWYLSQRADDWQRLLDLGPRGSWDVVHGQRGKGDEGHAGPWIRFLEGALPDYPEQILRANDAEMRRRLQAIADDQTTVDEQDVHHWQNLNPIGTEALVQLTLGGPQLIYHGGLLHTRLRWFDAAARRPGLPPEVGVLVEAVTPDSVSLQVANLHPTEARPLLVRAGMFGEHRFSSLACDGAAAQPVDAADLALVAQPRSVACLTLGLRRYAQPPSYAFPRW
ncbi:MAG: hypothetical protein IT204_19660 [Fimbriimonadaceae bacterium]|nr:hypothetical protein [Fimbriimonadaceae bacterium]